jgi:hypothetical protein
MHRHNRSALVSGRIRMKMTSVLPVFDDGNSAAIFFPLENHFAALLDLPQHSTDIAGQIAER